MSILLPVVTGILFVGDTFNYYTYDRGDFNVYDVNYQNTRMVPSRRSTAEFLLVKSTTDIPRFLGVDPDLSLRLKLFDKFRSEGITSFIREGSSRPLDEYVQILLKVEHHAVKEYAAYDTPISYGWKHTDPEEVGTHYIHSLVRGGYGVASIIFHVKNIGQRKLVERAVERHLGRFGHLPDDILYKLNKVNKEIGDNYPYQIERTYCLECREGSSIHQIIDLKNEFHLYFNQSGHERGSAILMELGPLSNLSSNFPPFVQKNRVVMAALKDFEEKYDDLEIARKEFERWEQLESRLHKLPKQQEDEIYQFYEKVEEIRHIFKQTFSKLDVRPDASVYQFAEAFSAYGFRYNNNYYQNHFRKLTQLVKLSLILIIIL